MRLTRKEIVALVKKGERLRVECKEAFGGLPDSLWESYSAFANTDGGVILLGVRECEDHSLEIQGVKNATKLIKSFWDVVNNREKVSVNTLLDHHVYSVGCGGKTVIVVDVPRADRRERPVYLGADVFRGSYRRNGEGDYRCTREAVMAMLRDQSDRTADATVLERTEISDFCAATLTRYRRDFAFYHPRSPWIDLPNDEFLKKIGAVARAPDGRIRPTIAGLVCFGEFASIIQELPNYFLDYRERLATSERWSDREYANDPDWSGNIIDFYYRIHDKVTAAVKTPFALDENDRRIEDTDVHKAVREIVANALVHTDYHGRRGIVIERRFEQITVSNPGTLRIAQSVAVDGGTSDPRNASIFNIFALIDVGERSGMGLNNLYAIWEREGFARPVVTEEFDPDRTILKFSTSKVGEGRVESAEGRVKCRVESRVESRVKPTACLGDAPSSVKRVYGALCEDSSLTYVALESKLGFSTQTIAVAIATLIQRGLLRRVGPKKGGHWEIVA